MKRRSFIKRVAPLSLLPFAINGQPIQSLASTMGLSHEDFVDTDNVLVLIQLNGGNDGLNMVLPIDQYANLTKARPNLYIPENKALKLNGTLATALHPAMTGLRGLYDEGQVNIVQSVGYPNQDFSHFRSTDIWLTASDSNQYIESGWIGRYLSEEYPNFPNGFPNTDMPDPLAIQIGSVVSPVCQGLSANMGFSVASVASFYQLVTGGNDEVPNTWAGKELDYIRTVASQSNAYSARIKDANDKATTKSTKYTANESLAEQLKIVAKLIAGGLKTRVYICTIGGFDTHSNQVQATGGTELGTHADLLKRVSNAISAFQDDINQLGIADRVMGMTFSEFGRRIIENGSTGTDHGSAAPLFLFGKKIIGGLTNGSPIIPENASVNTNLPMETDFRSIYATILQKWFCLDENTASSVLLKSFDTIDVINPSACSTTSLTRKQSDARGELNVMNYPNPFSGTTTIRFYSEGDNVRIDILNSVGQYLTTLTDTYYTEGKHEVVFSSTELPAGTYYYRFQQGLKVHTKSMLKV